MPEFLVFQLYGALASWGDIAVGEYRPSLGHPSKSAVTGLLAAALGIERDQDEQHAQLDQQYGVAVCVRSPGELLSDYHTVQVPAGKREYASRRDELLYDDKHKLKTILSKRDYRTDAFYHIALWSKNDEQPYTLHELCEALREPHFNLYLGRKSCPLSLPLQPIIYSGMNLKQVFNEYPHSKSQPLTGKLDGAGLVSYYWEEGNLQEEELGLNATMTYPRRDRIGSRKRWQFANRDEYYCADAVGG